MSNPVFPVPNPANPRVKHRLGGWLPSDPQHWRSWIKTVAEHVRKHPKKPEDLHPSIKQLWALIETNTEVRMFFSMMLEQVPIQPPYNTNPAGGPEFRSWQELLLAFDFQLTSGPIWLYNTEGQQGLIGFPFNALLDWPMGTPAGIYAFLREDINKCLRDMLIEYGAYLLSPESTEYLNSQPDGWFNETALLTMSEVASPPPSTKPFSEIYVCNPSLPSYGFTSWDDFFIRKFKPGIRPVYQPDNNGVITNCCESGPYNLQPDVKARDEFWIKGQPYSLADMFGSATLSSPYVGGTVYQAFLSALSYHCWHAPVSGIVKDIINIPGSYYAENYWEGFANIGTDGKPNPDPAAPNNSQAYICQVATRSVLILEADDQRIGEMTIVQVGMAEVSTCEWYIQKGQHIRKGDLIGTFHFGGSTHCLIFRPGVQLKFIPAAIPPYPEHANNLPVCGELATVL